MKNRNLWAFSIGSLLNDVASESTIRLIPLYLKQVLGAELPVIGLIEGVAQATATLAKLASGWLADRVPRRKPLVVLGYSLSAATKLGLLAVNHWTVIFAIRFLDRVGKGIRSAPKDSMIADEAHLRARGASFGLNQAMDTLGALIGVAIAAWVVREGSAVTEGQFRTVVLIALVPGFLSAATIWVGVREAPRDVGSEKARGTRSLPKAYWRYLAVVGVFTLANSSDAFLILRAAEATGSTVGAVLVFVLAMNLTSSLFSMPAGWLSDRFGRRPILAAGWVIYSLCYLGFGMARTESAFLGLFLLYGLFFAFTEATEKALIADLVPAESGRGYAYGAFAFATACLSFPASFGFGLLLQSAGAPIAFALAAGLSAIAAIGLRFAVAPAAPVR